MPITLPDTPVGSPIGPGFIVRVVTDLPGPLPPDAHWRLILTDIEGTAIACVGERTTTLKDVPITLGFDHDTGDHRLNPVTSTLVQGLDARLRVELTGTSTLLEFVEQTQKFDWVTGAQYVNAVLSTTSTQGGFTETDRQVIIATQASVTPSIPIDAGAGAQLAFQLADLVALPPVGALCLWESIPVSGTFQSLTRPGFGNSVFAYGAYILFEVVPPELGVNLDGKPVFRERMAQVLVYRTDQCGSQYLAFVYDLEHDEQRLEWGYPFPTRVIVSTLPGVTLRWTWLMVGQPPP